MKKYSIALLVCSVSISITIVSCKKHTVDNEVQSVIDNAICEQEFMRIPVTVNGRAMLADGIKKMMPGYQQIMSGTCPKDSVTGDTSGYASGAYTNATNLPGLQLDWGSGCTDQLDAVMRSGKLNSTFSKPYSQVGSIVTISLSNYKAGSVTYSGTIKVTRAAINVLNVEVMDG